MCLKDLLSTSIASAITAAEVLLEEMGAIHIWIVTIIPSTTRSISKHIPTSNKICSLIPYLKHCGHLVWCTLGCMLTLLKRIVTRRPRLRQIIASGNSPLKYFRGYWETMKIFLLNISNNEIISDENFPDYGICTPIINNIPTYIHTVSMNIVI